MGRKKMREENSEQIREWGQSLLREELESYAQDGVILLERGVLSTPEQISRACCCDAPFALYGEKVYGSLQLKIVDFIPYEEHLIREKVTSKINSGACQILFMISRVLRGSGQTAYVLTYGNGKLLISVDFLTGSRRNGGTGYAS